MAITAAPPPFVATVAHVTQRELGASWRLGCPVGPATLRRVTLSYWGFDGARHSGQIVVNVDATAATVTIFGRLYRERFPLRRVRPIATYGGSDDASMAADNTSGFNCRAAVAPGPKRWSVHAYGRAIDVNPVENPYVEGGRVLPSRGATFVDRSRRRPGMAEGALVAAFASVGWSWGGRWSDRDYQHFSANGR